GPVVDYESALKSNTTLYGQFWRGMMAKGVWLAPSQFEASFTSAGMIPDDIDEALDQADSVLAGLKP
ncbi:MAG: aspartate aminotransferase family protein, partial [Candidatus Adiutrix sp.]